jgi:hypothetical protein
VYPRASKFCLRILKKNRIIPSPIGQRFSRHPTARAAVLWNGVKHIGIFGRLTS